MKLHRQPMMALKVFAKCEVSMCEQVGCGSFGPVFQCKLMCKTTFDDITVKVYKGQATVCDLQRELGVLGHVEHENLSKIHGLIAYSDGVGLVIEPIRGASLCDAMFSCPSPPMALRLAWIDKISSALSYLHKLKIVHRDIKPGNILFRDEFNKNPVITDYGMARFYERFVPGWSRCARYAAPEASCALTCTAKSDIYSLGLILWQVITLQRIPEESLPTLQMVPDIEERVILARCWNSNPAERPEIEEIREIFSY